MPTFQVSLNGKKIATTGVGELGVLTAIVSWVGRKPPKSSRGAMLEIGGLDTSRKTHEHVSWGQRTLTVGDEVVIRVAKDGRISRPRGRKRMGSEAQNLRAQQQMVRRMAKEFGWKITTR